MTGVRGWPAIVAGLYLALVQPGQARQATPPAPGTTSLTGDYVASEMELAAGLRLSPDGTFLYGLTVGSLDQQARGRWEADGKRIRLTSEPRPVPPTVAASRIESTPGQPFAIRLLGPSGRDARGVDLRIEFDDGEVLDDYIAGEGWSLPADEKRVPRFVTFGIPSHKIVFSRLPIDARPGTTAIFALTPNDFGVVDMTDAMVTVEGDALTLTYALGTLKMKRRKGD